MFSIYFPPRSASSGLRKLLPLSHRLFATRAAAPEPCQTVSYTDAELSRKAFFPTASESAQSLSLQSARLHSFTEERHRFSLPKQSQWHKGLCMAFANNVLHVLTSHPFGIYSVEDLPTSADDGDGDVKYKGRKGKQRMKSKGVRRKWLYLDEVLPFQAQSPQLTRFQDKLLMFLPSLSMAIIFPPSGGKCQIIRLPAVKRPKRQRSSGIIQSIFAANEDSSIHFNDSLLGEGIYVVAYGNHIVDIMQVSAQADLSSKGLEIGDKVSLERVHLPKDLSISSVTPISKDRFILVDAINDQRAVLLRDDEVSRGADSEFIIHRLDRHKVDLGQTEAVDLEKSYASQLEQIDAREGISVRFRPEMMSHPMALMQRISASTEPTFEVHTTPFVDSRETSDIVKSVVGRSGSILTLRRSEDSGSSLDVIDLHEDQTMQIPIENTATTSSTSPVDLCALPGGDCAVLFGNDSGSTIDVRIYQTSRLALDTALNQWQRMLGLQDSSSSSSGSLSLSISSSDTLTSDSPPPLDTPKHGKEDPSNAPHVGGNTWAGGTGGSNTAGLGGRGGPYRLDKGHPVYQVSEAAKAEVSAELAGRMREVNRKAFSERLKEIELGASEAEEYAGLLQSVEREVEQLRDVLSALDWRRMERTWVKNKAYGELDDAKLIDGLTGEKLVFKTREEQPVDSRMPKRILFLMDLSGSMYRFNGQDGRLQRQCALAVMLMEALAGAEERLQYAMVGHSGEDEAIELVPFGKPPASQGQRLQVVQRMVAHSQFCLSGDMTVEAVQRAVQSITEEDADDYFVFAISDANLRRYGIPPSRLAAALNGNADVNAFAIFIASIGEEAGRIQSEMPRGKAFTCFDTAQLPHLLKDIFASQVLRE